MNAFWDVIDQQLAQLRSATTADEVVRVLALERNPCGPEVAASNADGFFAGSGGDGSVLESLTEAGWRVVWAEASYFYVAQAPDGSCITYIEGDVYRGDHRPEQGG